MNLTQLANNPLINGSKLWYMENYSQFLDIIQMLSGLGGPGFFPQPNMMFGGAGGEPGMDQILNFIMQNDPK